MLHDRLRPISEVVRDTIKQIDDYQYGRLHPIFTSSEAETELLGGFFPGDITTLAAASGIGKTARLIRMLIEFCSKKYNKKTYKKIVMDFDSWEMADTAVVLRIVSSQMFIQTKQLLKQDSLTPEQRQKLIEVSQIISKLPIKINQIPQDIERYKDVKEERCDWALENGVQILFANDHTRMAKQSSEANEERKITGFYEADVVLSKHPAKPMFFKLSQLNRNYELRLTEKERGNNLPIKSDIFGSDAAYQCSHNVCIFHRPGYYKVSEFEGVDTGYRANNVHATDDLWIESWLKQREGKSGMDIFMRHQIEHLKFTDL